MNVSDFKIAEFFIRCICKNKKLFFIDIPLKFSNDNITPFIEKDTLVIRDTDKLSKTIFQIVAGYLQNIEIITGEDANISNEERILFLNMVLSLLRDITYNKTSFTDGFDQKTIELSLNREPYVFIVMKSIICPAFNKPVKNIKIKARKDSHLDGAKHIKKGDFGSDDDFVFCNMDIENKACRAAYILYETIKAHGLDPLYVIHNLFTKQELWSKFFGITRAAFVDNDSINDFMTMLSILSGNMGSVEKRLLKNSEKQKTGLWSQGQAMGNYPQHLRGNSNWWYLGLIEKMLEPARGSDWSGYYTMKSITDELWEKIELEKKRRGMKELPMESLLRIQAEEFKSQPDLVIEGLLSNNRVW